jgi:UDP-hydrolysing UDP-N-acetyl-D-glucosamine 2-epimerase
LKKKLLFISSNRADTSILKNIILELGKSNLYKLELFLCGSHFTKYFGKTIGDFNIFKNLKIHTSKIIKFNESSKYNENILFKNQTDFFNILKKNKPNLVFIPGDRLEMLAFSYCCHFLDIKICHIHGGELTFGSKDDSTRHAITKLSHLHLVSNNIYRKRVIRLGEKPNSVFTIGSPSLNKIQKYIFKTKTEIQKKFSFNFFEKNILVCFHSSKDKIEDKNILKLIFEISRFYKDILFIFTISNFDHNSFHLNEKIIKHCQSNNNSILIKSFGDEYYLSCLKYVNCILGNSSSAIIEAPSVKTPSIDLGSRQLGRIRSASVIRPNLNFNRLKILINQLIYNKIELNFTNPYFKNNGLKNLNNIINNIDNVSLKKQFYE